MKNATISEKLNEADGLLREHRFHEAVALTTLLEEAVAAADADAGSPSRVATWTRDRLHALRWAAEIGRKLTYLAGPHGRPQQGPSPSQSGARGRRKVTTTNSGLHATQIQWLQQG